MLVTILVVEELSSIYLTTDNVCQYKLVAFLKFYLLIFGTLGSDWRS